MNSKSVAAASALSIPDRSSCRENSSNAYNGDKINIPDTLLGQIVNQSQTSADALNGAGFCGKATPLLAGPTGPHAQGRCGYGPRQPLLVISPWARSNFVDHLMTDQTSVLRFVEDNWLAGQRIGQGSYDAIASSITQMFDFSGHGCARTVTLDPTTGEVVSVGCK